MAQNLLSRCRILKNSGSYFNKDLIKGNLRMKRMMLANTQANFKEQTASDVWGIASAIDIYDCNPFKIRDAETIKTFVVELCDLIQMRRFGETQVVHFGEDEKVAGFSMVQLIETSLISAHFANLTNTIYLDVFSCKAYDSETVRKFAQDYFGGTHSNLNVTMRY